MILAQFEVTKIGPMYREANSKFSRCEAVVGVREANSEAQTLIKIDLVVSHKDEETLGTVKARILSESEKILRAAANSLAGKTVQELHAETDVESARALEQIARDHL